MSNKMTLLQMTQNILNAMKSDEVNSINDTIESQAVAEIIKETYYDLLSTLELPERVGHLKISGVSDLTRPAMLQLGDTVVSINWLKYYNAGTLRYEDVSFVSPEEFFRDTLKNISTDDNVASVTLESNLTYYVKDDKQPEYYTVSNDKYLLFDSYDSDEDSTLQASKTFAWGEVQEEWSNTDAFIPELDATLFPLLLAEAKSVCFIDLKEQANQKEEQRARKGRVHLQYKKWRDKKERANRFEGPNYARLR